MARKLCLDCGAPSTGPRCPEHTRAKDRERTAKRTHYSGDYVKRRADLLATSTHCWLCGEPLTGYPWPHQLSSTADHVVPSDANSELRAAHLACNAGRGNRPA
jgi:hypothetical protein